MTRRFCAIKKKATQTLVFGLFSANLVACGGGGGGASPPPSPPPPAPDTRLSDLAVSAGALTPGFASNVFSYTLTVPDATATVAVTATAADPAAAIAINGTSTGSGTASPAIATPYGASSISVLLTNGSASQTTSIQVVREDSSAASAAIVFPAGGLTDAESITVTGTADDPDSGIASVTVNGVAATSTDGFATWSAAAVPLTTGNNPLVVAVQNGGLVSNAMAAEASVEREVLLIDPREIELDGQRALIIDGDRGALIAADLTTGELSRVDRSGVELAVPSVLAVDSTGGRAWVGDDELDAIVEIDTVTGNRAVLSAAGTATGPELIEYYGLAADTTNDRLVAVALAARNAVLSVDLTSGDRSVITEDFATPTVPVSAPRDIAIDVANNRGLVNDLLRDLVLGVDLSGLNPTSIVSSATQGSGPDIQSPTGIDYDGVRALLLDSIADAVVDVNLATGDRNVFSNAANGAGPELDAPVGIALDPANDRAIVVDAILDAVISVDLATGDRSLVAQTSRGSGEPAFSPVDVDVDTAGNRLFVVDEFRRSLIAVDMSTAERTAVSVDLPTLDDSYGLAFDDVGNRALFLDPDSQAVLAIDLSTGMIDVVSQTNNVGSGPDLSFPRDLSIDRANNRLLVTELFPPEAVLAIDLATGDRAYLSAAGSVGGGPPFEGAYGLALDAANGRALVVNDGGASVIAVDLLSGNRSILSDDNTGTGAAFGRPTNITIDARNNRALVVETQPPSIVAVDLATGNRTPIVDEANGAGPFSAPEDVVAEPSTGRLIFVDRSLSSALEIESSSGDRLIISK